MLSRRLLHLLMMGALLCLASRNLQAQDSATAKPAPAAESNPAEKSAAPAELALPLSEIEKAYEGSLPPESVKMLLAIVRGSKMGPGEGWFGPADMRYSWKWLAERHGVADTEGIPAKAFLGTERWFAQLDRNRDGRITADDLDWSDNNPWVKQASAIQRVFRRMEMTGDGRLSREEWMSFFDSVTQDQSELTAGGLRDAVLAGKPGAATDVDMPTQAQLIRGLFAGEVGSLYEGPRLDTRAPDFSLKTHDGTETVRLNDLIGKKPVVLTFGNFTCGPFRGTFPAVEEVHQRFGDEVIFLAVYVREAHPTDGWKMDGNKRVGVEVAQPKTFAERTLVATQCHKLLKPTMPLLVDEINDPVGTAYSGMPSRLYVIDLDGKVAYKSGRGPFGFKPGEMEQALVMTLLDRAPEKTPVSESEKTTAAPAK